MRKLLADISSKKKNPPPPRDVHQLEPRLVNFCPLILQPGWRLWESRKAVFEASGSLLPSGVAFAVGKNQGLSTRAQVLLVAEICCLLEHSSPRSRLTGTKHKIRARSMGAAGPVKALLSGLGTRWQEQSQDGVRFTVISQEARSGYQGWEIGAVLWSGWGMDTGPLYMSQGMGIFQLRQLLEGSLFLLLY